MKHLIHHLRSGLLAAVPVGLWLAASAGGYELTGDWVDSKPEGALSGSSGRSAWDAAALREVSGLQSVRLDGSRALGMLGASAARFPVVWDGKGADLDLGFNDFFDIELQLPAGFAGGVFLDYAAERGGDKLERIALPVEVMANGGRPGVHRLELGLVPWWRGFLSRAELVIEPDAGSRGKPVAVGKLMVGDFGEVPVRYEELNMKPGMKVSDLLFLESKHGCIWWEKSHEAEGFDPEVMPRRSLRMLEESWQVFVRLLKYRDPCLGLEASNRKPYKINHTTWHGGFWMGADRRFPYFNVSEGGLRDEGWGNPVPHEFAHCVQGAAINFLRGCHWESHANYLRFHRNHHFREVVGVDSMPFDTLMRAAYFQDHPRLIYADFRPYFYLDSDPDGLGFAEGLTSKLWQTGTKDELFWDRLATVLPGGVTREDVAAGMARSWLTFRFEGGDHHRQEYFPDNPVGRIRQFRVTTPLVAVPDRPQWFAVPLGRAPMKFGWCYHDLVPQAGTVQGKLEGVDLAGDGESWRWGFVALRKGGGEPVQSAIFSPGEIGQIEVPADVERLAMFVCATPADASLPYPRLTPDYAADRHPQHRRYPYEITLKGAVPADYAHPDERDDGKKHPNGGGFVASSARVDASAYVAAGARVLGSAQVLGNARILDRAVVKGAATVKDQAIVSGGAVVGGRAEISGMARVRGFAFIEGEAKVRERARVGDFTDLNSPSEIFGDAVVRGMSQPLERGRVGGHAILDADYAMGFDLDDGVHYHHVPWGGWYFDEFAAKLRKPRGLVASYDFREPDGGQAMDKHGSLHAVIRGPVVREKSGLVLDGKESYVLVDSSVIDSPAVTWQIEASCTGRGMQPIFAVNDWAREGLMLGLGENGRLAVVLKRNGEPAVTLASPTPVARGGVIKVALRLDGERAALFHDGRKVAEQPWSHAPLEWFRDLSAGEPSMVYLGRDAAGSLMTGRINQFSAFNTALDDDEISIQSKIP